MMRRLRVAVAIAAAVLLGCSAPSGEAVSSHINVAAAANVSRVFPVIAEAFTAETGVTVIFTFGATAQLAQQIEAGAPFDLYASADTEHVDALVAKGLIVPESTAVYTRGLLVLWTGKSGLARIEDLASDDVRFVAVAKPEIAPYGRAAIEVLEHLGIRNSVEPKIVYAQNVTMAKQLVDSGNAEAAFVAGGLLDAGHDAISVDPSLYRPIEQALGVVAASARRPEATRFAEYLIGETGQRLLQQFGYGPSR